MNACLVLRRRRTREEAESCWKIDHQRRSFISLSLRHRAPSDPPFPRTGLENTDPARRPSRWISYSLSVTAHILSSHFPSKKPAKPFFLFQSLGQPRNESESSGSPLKRSNSSTRCASFAARARAATTAGAASLRSRPPSRRPLGPRTSTR